MLVQASDMQSCLFVGYWFTWVTKSQERMPRRVPLPLGMPSMWWAFPGTWQSVTPAGSTAAGMLGGDGAPDTSCAWISPCWPGGEFTHVMKQAALFELHSVRWNTNKLRLKTSADDCIFWWIWTAGHNSALNLPKPVSTGSWTSTSYCMWSSPGSQGSWQLLVSLSSITTAGFN